jgi:multiple sugar transport system permease protein
MKRRAHPLAILLIVIYTAVMLAPIGWMVITAFKTGSDTTSPTPGLLPTFETDKRPAKYYFRFTTDNFRDQFKSEGSNNFLRPLVNSLVVASVSTVVSVVFGGLAAYGFSRFKMRGSKDWQFFILSTRMLPALAVAIPIAIMYEKLGLTDTRFGLILLYTCFNLSFSTWMMKAFIDEIPTAYEEAALLDGYSRAHVLFRIVLPQATTGLLATAVFCLIASWNEYAFAVTLTRIDARTLPPYLTAVFSDPGRIPYGPLAAGALLFMAPIVLFSLLMRKHLLRGITFGAVKG